MLIRSCVISLSPHVCSEDNEYKGIFIRKGTIVLPNIWELHRDAEVYGTDADWFNPDRHLDEKGEIKSNNDNHMAFGAYSLRQSAFDYYWQLTALIQALGGGQSHSIQQTVFILT